MEMNLFTTIQIISGLIGLIAFICFLNICFDIKKIRRILEDESTTKKKEKLDDQYWTCPKCGFSKNLNTSFSCGKCNYSLK